MKNTTFEDITLEDIMKSSIEDAWADYSRERDVHYILQHIMNVNVEDTSYTVIFSLGGYMYQTDLLYTTEPAHRNDGKLIHIVPLLSSDAAVEGWERAQLELKSKGEATLDIFADEKKEVPHVENYNIAVQLFPIFDDVISTLSEQQKEDLSRDDN